MKKLYFYSDEELKNPIIINKLGITFRKIKDIEVNILVDYFKNEIINIEFMKLINYYINNIENNSIDFKDEKKNREFTNFNKKLKAMPKEQYDSYFYLLKEKIDGKNFSKRNIKSNILKFHIVEVQEDKFCKMYPLNYVEYFLARLAKLTSFLNSNELFVNQKDKFSFFLAEEEINIKNIEITSKFFLNKGFIKNDISFAYLSKLVFLLNKKDIYFNFHILSIIDALYDQSSIENEIINKVGLIERLIIKENEDIEKAFVLKAGILCKKGKFGFEELPKMLKSIYDVRSYLVHGNDKLLFEKLDVIGKQFGVTNLKSDKFNNKIEVLASVKVFLDLFLKDILILYITDNDFCEYLKNN